MPLRRLEDRRYLMGSAGYVGDLALPGMLHAVFVRSPHAHARIRRVDVERARRESGVAAIWTAAEVNAVTAP
ncbi:MAG: hypothetical protein H0T18_02255, partial [Chloroflexia bacterium]|nr:hypothetical protein [Chloroflexia bacterium]